MDRHHVENGIRRSWDFVERLKLVETFSSPNIFYPDESWRNASLRSDRRYNELYNFALSNSCYNFLLSDYSFFQFCWSELDHVRYAYYPNPYISNDDDLAKFKKRQELLEADFLSLEDYLGLLQSSSGAGRIPMFRYENAPRQWKELSHPCSHLHIGFHSDNRWAVSRLLTPMAFTMLVVKQYFGKEWMGLGYDDTALGCCCFENDLISERQACRQIGDDLFSDNERRSFHIS